MESRALSFNVYNTWADVARTKAKKKRTKPTTAVTLPVHVKSQNDQNELWDDRLYKLSSYL